MKGMEALLARLNETYVAVDRALRAYSEAANAGDPGANRHYAEADRLQAEARAIVAELSKPRAS